MTGIRLTLKDRLTDSAPAQLLLFLPYDNLSDYERQKLLSLDTRIAWQQRAADGYLYGLEFVRLTEAQSRLLQECFHYHNKIPASTTVLG